MSNSALSTLESLVRSIVQDETKTDSDVFEYVASGVFRLTEDNALSVSDVTVNGESVDSGEFSYASATQRVTVTASLSAGDVVEIFYTYYEKYSQTEIYSYLKSAITYCIINNYKNFLVEDESIYPEPNFKDRNLISMIASILIRPDNSSYSLPDISFRAPEGSKPTPDMIRDVITIMSLNSHGIFSIG